MDEVEVVVAHQARATLRVGDVFLKVDGDQTYTDVEVEAMTLAPVPTPEILWRRPPVLALAALPGAALGRLGRPSTASAAAWTAAGATLRVLHDAPLPAWSGKSLDEKAASLDVECTWLLTNDVLPADLVTRNRELAGAALRPWTPVFMHGDLQVAHVFVEGDEVTGILDWSEAGQGDAMYDISSLTLGHPEHLDDVVAGYGADAVDLDVVRAWWSLRSLTAIRWLVEHGFDPAAPGCEIDVLRAQALRRRFGGGGSGTGRLRASLTVKSVVPWTGCTSLRSASTKPTFASTRREAAFQSQTVAQMRWWPSDVAQSRTATEASVA